MKRAPATAACLPLRVWNKGGHSTALRLSLAELGTARPLAFVCSKRTDKLRTYPTFTAVWLTTPLLALSSAACTLHHILVNCDFALKQKRYTWRHDSVLKNIEMSLVSLVTGFNRKMPSSLVKATRKGFEACFVKKGELKKQGNKRPDRVSQSVLECANDRKLLVDFDTKKQSLPPAISPRH